MITANELHITKYGYMIRADQLVAVAKYLAKILSAQNTVSGKSMTFDDGSSVHVARRDTLYLTTIWGAYPPKPVTPDEEEEEVIPPTITHGIVTDPMISSGAVLEFTRSKQLRTEKEEARIPNKTLKTPISSAIYEYFNPAIRSWSQAGTIVPTMYSGRMRDAVQMAIAVSDHTVTYSPTFYTTHGLTNIGGTFMIVEVSEKGVLLAPLGVREVPEGVATGFTDIVAEFSGIPDGKVPTAWIELIDDIDMGAVYDGASPVFDPLHGWVFSSRGDTMMIIMEYGDDDVGYTTQHHMIEIKYNDTTSEYSATLTSYDKLPVTCPQRLLDAIQLFGPAHAELIHKPFEYDTKLFYGWSQYQNQPWIYEPDPGMPVSSSWNITYVPVWSYERMVRGSFYAQDTAKLAVKEYPLHAYEPSTMHVVDVPIHVTCVDDVFIIMNYYWAIYPVRNAGMTLLSGGGNQTLEVSSDLSTANTYFYYGPLLGVPPTIYTSLVDNRRYGAMNTYVHREWYSMPPSKIAQLPAPYNVSFQYRFENAHMHDEIVLPHLCREAFIHNSYDYRGRHLSASDPKFTKTVAYEAIGQRHLNTHPEGDIFQGSNRTFATVSEGESDDGGYMVTFTTEETVKRVSSYAMTPTKQPIEIPQTRVDGVESLMRPLNFHDTEQAYIHFHESTSRTFIVAPKAYPYIPDGYVGCRYYPASTFHNLLVGTDYTYIGAHPATPSRDTLGLMAEEYQADKINQYSYMSDIGTRNAIAFFLNSEGGIRGAVFLDMSSRWPELDSPEYSMSAQAMTSDRAPDVIDINYGSTGNGYYSNNKRPPMPVVSVPAYCVVSPDYSTVRVYCPGLALPDAEPCEPYIPKFANAHFARSFTVDKTTGASMGYSTIGAFSMFIKTRSKDCAGFGALPRGLTLLNDDTICYVGELKDG